MFESPIVPVYVKDWWPEVKDEKRFLKLRLIVNPITHALAREIGDEIADALFSRNGGEYQPRSCVSQIHLLKTVPAYSLTLIKHEEVESGRIFIPSALITDLVAQKLFPQKPDFGLLFSAEFESLDRAWAADLLDLLKEKLFITFKLLQPSLFQEDPHAGKICRMQTDTPCELPEFVTTDGRFYYCAVHEIMKADGEKTKRIRDHAKARAAVAEMQEEASNDGPKPEVAGTDIPAGSSSRRSRK
jgi:hypothetical protein